MFSFFRASGYRGRPVGREEEQGARPRGPQHQEGWKDARVGRRVQLLWQGRVMTKHFFHENDILKGFCFSLIWNSTKLSTCTKLRLEQHTNCIYCLNKATNVKQRWIFSGQRLREGSLSHCRRHVPRRRRAVRLLREQPDPKTQTGRCRNRAQTDPGPSPGSGRIPGRNFELLRSTAQHDSGFGRPKQTVDGYEAVAAAASKHCRC